eukprot:GFYU01006310.1.p1 GENE.GFYU01006310.1~~GFYU01006310.1.p1  ORF type:complete len:408 (-),score=119.18 GFYU01006310.1:433-1656(-)
MVSSKDELHAINSVRVLAAEMVNHANSGHPGAPMGCAPMAHTLFSKVMKFNPKNPEWANRDRFVLSNGHGCALQYIMLHLAGYNVTMQDLKQFRAADSKTPGHPEVGITPGVELVTGPLGQGISQGVGMAVGAKHMGAVYNKPDFPLFDHNIFVICGDGCLQEGVSSEASSLAGHLGLGNLVVLYDDNGVTIDGSKNLAFTENVLDRYKAYGWHTQRVAQGDDDCNAILEAVQNAKAETKKPSIIAIKTTIGFGADKAGTNKMHSLSHGGIDVGFIRNSLGMNGIPPFTLDDSTRKFYAHLIQRGVSLETDWDGLFAAYCSKFPAEGATLKRILTGELPSGWKSNLPKFTPDDKALATRQSSELVLKQLFPLLPELIGGSADLTNSNLCYIPGSPDFQFNSPQGTAS